MPRAELMERGTGAQPTTWPGHGPWLIPFPQAIARQAKRFARLSARVRSGRLVLLRMLSSQSLCVVVAIWSARRQKDGEMGHDKVAWETAGQEWRRWALRLIHTMVDWGARHE
eukprot:8877246-Ditylum_brightwellii.AAC.1